MNDTDGAVEDFSAVRELAVAAGLPRWELKGMMEQCRVYYWIDRPRCLALVTEAVERAGDLNDETIEIQIRGSWAGWHNTLQGWSEHYIRDCRRALDMARATQNREPLNSSLTLHSSFEYARADYRSAIAVSREAMEIARNKGDALQYMVCKALCIRSLLHMGEWGEARRHIADALQMAERNGNVFATAHFTLLMSWLHEQAFDYQGARSLCQAAMDKIHDPRDSSNAFFVLIRLGAAHLGLGQYSEAFDSFSRCGQLLNACRGLMDWYLRPLFHLGVGEYWLSQKEWEKAEEQAKKLCALAGLPPDPTYLALGHRLAAEAAIGRKALDTACAETEKALFHIGKTEAPPAAWRVYATAAELKSRMGCLPEADIYRSRSAAILRRLAESMDETDALRRSLLRHPLLNPVGGA